MNVRYEPWADSHAPKCFHRTDPTGRWSPIHEIPEPQCMAWVGGIAMGLVFALLLFWGV